MSSNDEGDSYQKKTESAYRPPRDDRDAYRNETMAEE
jgi:hypothetical protein